MRNGFPNPVSSVLLAILMLVSAGCATLPAQRRADSRPFDFKTDALSFANELDWVYRKDPVTQKMDFFHVDPEPDYIHHCFVVVRAAKQFFLHARFDPAAPKADEPTYRRLVKAVFERSPRELLPDPQRIVIPGYADLRSFSTAWTQLLKEEAGGSWHSYAQMGNWRMVFPFSRSHQAETADELVEEIQADWPPIIHMVRFPVITINHAVMLYAARETDREILFSVYDPNHPEAPAELTYDRASRTFIFPATDYFADGRVDVYEVYRGLLH